MLTQNASNFCLCVSKVKGPPQRFVTIVGESRAAGGSMTGAEEFNSRSHFYCGKMSLRWPLEEWDYFVSPLRP